MYIEYNSGYCIAVKYSKSFVDYMSANFGLENFEEEVGGDNALIKGDKGYFLEAGNLMYFYSGFLPDIVSNYKKETITINSNLPRYTSLKLNLPKFLYEHQKKILASIINNKRGLVQSPTGSGKSIVIAECIYRFNKEGLNSVITVPTIDLLNQLKQDIINYSKLSNKTLDFNKIGLIGGGNMDLDLDKYTVHIAIPQSLCKIDKTKEVLNRAEVLIADECQYNGNNTYASIIKESINNQIRIGLSATPWTNNGNNILLKGFFGNMICKVTEEDMINNNIIMKPIFLFYNSPKGFLPSKLSEFASNISSLPKFHRYKVLNQVYNYLILNNAGRNKLIVDLAIKRSTSDYGPVVIIVNKVNDVKGKVGHASILKTMFEHHNKHVKVISGSVRKKDRVDIIQKLKDSQLDIVIAGPKVLTAGINIPSLNTIILAGAGKSDSDLIQRVGRLLRKKEGKVQPLVIDFMDSQYWFNNQSYTRMNVVKSVYGEKNISVI